MESLQTIFKNTKNEELINQSSKKSRQFDFQDFLKVLKQTRTPLSQNCHIVRIRAQENILSKSFEMKQQNLVNLRQKQRRKSGSDKISEKQLRIDCLYPKTYIQQSEKQQQRTKERKKTVLKRMSSILIKHQTKIKSIGNKNSENQLLLIQQVQSEKQSDDLTPQSIIQKKMFRSSMIDPETPKVVLNIQRKQNKPFASIKSYINEKSVFSSSSNPFLNYVPSQSLTEMNQQILSPSTQRKSCRLPDLRVSARICHTEIGKCNIEIGKLKHNNVYCSQSLKKKRIIK